MLAASRATERRSGTGRRETCRPSAARRLTRVSRWKVSEEKREEEEEEPLEVPLGGVRVKVVVGGGVSVSCFSHDCKVMLRGGWGVWEEEEACALR